MVGVGKVAIENNVDTRPTFLVKKWNLCSLFYNLRA